MPGIASPCKKSGRAARDAQNALRLERSVNRSPSPGLRDKGAVPDDCPKWNRTVTYPCLPPEALRKPLRTIQGGILGYFGVVAQRTECSPAKAEVTGSNPVYPTTVCYNTFMAKVDQKKMKRLKNEEYAKKFRKTHTTAQVDPEKKRKGGKYANWCRITGHPPSCDCVYR